MKPLFLAAFLLLCRQAHAQYIYTPAVTTSGFTYQLTYAPPVWAAGPVYWSPYGVERELRYIRWTIEDEALYRRRLPLRRFGH
jgi:hypothetical protein